MENEGDGSLYIPFSLVTTRSRHRGWLLNSAAWQRRRHTRPAAARPHRHLSTEGGTASNRCGHRQPLHCGEIGANPKGRHRKKLQEASKSRQLYNPVSGGSSLNKSNSFGQAKCLHANYAFFMTYVDKP